MKPKILPTEFTINMLLEKIMILQQSHLPTVNLYNYFNEDTPCHIYFICRRPRVTIKPNSFSATDSSLAITFKVQRQDNFEEYTYTLENDFGENVTIETEYPFSVLNLLKMEKLY